MDWTRFITVSKVGSKNTLKQQPKPLYSEPRKAVLAKLLMSLDLNGGGNRCRTGFCS